MKPALLRCALLFAALTAGAQTPAPASPDAPTQGQWGDQGNGTYANPVLPADISDLDAIRVGDTFYAITSTMQFSPGMTVLSSKDLVNWTLLGGVVPDLTALDPELNWDRMNRPGRGIWAGAIRSHAGRFWVYFATPDQGIFMSTATNPAGPWTPVAPVMQATGWDDTCPFWDDDGRLYLVTSHTAPEGPSGTKYNIHLFELTPDGKSILPGSDRIIHQSRGSEANKLYKWGGFYYHYFSEVRPEGRVAMMERARSLAGPWEVRQLQHVHGAVDKEPNQGGIVQAPDGRWWFFTHQGRGDWEGRAAVLLPVTWVDRTPTDPGWPILGTPGPDGIGTMVWRDSKPVEGQPLTTITTSDSFESKTLKPAWQWNYQPRAGFWSLSERPGHLRLHAFAPLRPDDLKAIGNVLTQRSFRSTRNEVTVELDTAGLQPGQQAGLVHFARTAAALTVTATRTGAFLIQVAASGQAGATGSMPDAIALPVINLLTGELQPARTIWLRSTWGFDGLSQFAYSLDGKVFTAIGSPYQLTWGSYRGDRIGLYTVDTRATPAGEVHPAGYADFTRFSYTVAR